MSPSHPDDLIPLREAARLLSCCVATVRRYAARGLVRSWRRAGHVVLVSRAEVLGLAVEPAARGKEVRPMSGTARDARTREILAAWGLG